MLPQKFLLLKCAVKDLYCVSYLRFGREEQVAESEVKYPTPSHKGSEIWLLKSVEIVVHSKKAVSTKVSKEIEPSQQEFAF